MMNEFQLEKNLRRLKPDLAQRFGVKKIGFFNCYIDLRHNPRCEANILVELNKPLGWEFFRLKEYLENKLQTEIDICTPRALKPALKDEILNRTTFA